MRLELEPLDEGSGTFKQVRLHVYLSKKNLLALLTKLDHPDSACTIASIDSPGGRFLVTSEPDDLHYSHESRRGTPAGRMVDWTEEDIQKVYERFRDAT